jgi:CheY-like chemotaxis protein
MGGKWSPAVERLHDIWGGFVMHGDRWGTDDDREATGGVVDLEFYRVRRRARNGVLVLTDGTEFFERVGRALRGVASPVALVPNDDPAGEWHETVARLHPAVVLVDARMQSVDPAIAIGLLERRYPVPAILVGSFGRGGTTSLIVRRAFAAGAYDAVDWRLDPEALPSAVNVLLKMRNTGSRY